MTQDLLTGLVALTIAVGLFTIGLPNKHGESQRLLQFYAAPMVYPAVDVGVEYRREVRYRYLLSSW